MLARLYKDPSPAYSKETGFNMLLLIRIALAVILAAAGLILSSVALLKTVLLILATVVAAYDIVHETIDSVASLKFITSPVIFCFVLFIAFLIGFGTESAIAAILYQIGKIAICFFLEKTDETALDCVRAANEDEYEAIREELAEKEALPAFAVQIEAAAAFVLKLLMVAAVLYMIIVPIVFNLSVVNAIHRGLAILIIASPAACVVSAPSIAKFALCFARALGVNVKSSETVASTEALTTAVIAKNGVYTENAPKVLSVSPEHVDEKIFMRIAANAVYNSNQSFADAIIATGNYDILESLISDFQDVPGYGVKLKIQGKDVMLATREYMFREGVPVPDDTPLGGKNYYLSFGGQYIGRIVIRESIKAAADTLVENLKANGIDTCVLLSEEDQTSAENFAVRFDFDDVVGGVTAENLDEIIAREDADHAAFIHAEALDHHSPAKLDVRVGKKAGCEDILLDSEDICNLPEALRVCRRMKLMIAENAILVFVVKALLVMLSMLGVVNIWFAVFLDIAAQLAAILNVSRVSATSFIDGMKK